MIGFRALSLAADEGHTKMLELLLKNGAELGTNLTHDIPSNHAWYDDGTTPPLIAAAGQGHCKAVEVLLKHGASPNEKNKTDDYSVLMTAVDNGQFTVAEILLRSGASPNAIAPHSYREFYCSALHLAADYKAMGEWDGFWRPTVAYRMIRLLLLAGANVKFGELLASDPGVKVIKEGEAEDEEDQKEYTETKDNDWRYTIKEKEIKSALELMYEEAFSYDYGSAKSVHLLYAAGTSIYEIGDRGDNGTNEEGAEAREDREVLQLIHADQQPLLSLQGLCRRQIRAHLLSSAGGNHPNLITVMPKLPVPITMQKYLLFNVPNIFEDYHDPDEVDSEEHEGGEHTQEMVEEDIPNAMEEGDE